MVLALRSGQSIRSVAEPFRVNKSTVERWKRRTKGKRIDRIDWTDQADGPPRHANRSSEDLEQCVLDFRKQLKEESILGEHEADAILREMQNCECPNPPSTATINRILRRHGAFDGRVRKRRTPPPPGWYFRVDFLALARKNAELDQFDYVEDLCIQGGTIFNVLNVVSLHGGLVGSWPMSRMTAENTVRSACLFASSKTLIEHWMEFGLPDDAQFDNLTAKAEDGRTHWAR